MVLLQATSSLQKTLQLDCGIHPGLSGLDALPYTDMIDAEEIDLLLITQYAFAIVKRSFVDIQCLASI